MSVTVQWINHASFRLSDGLVAYIDPWKLPQEPHDADLVLVSHNHYDHFSPEDIDKVSRPDTQLITTADVIEALGRGRLIKPEEIIDLGSCRVIAVPAYNPNKQFHPRANDWIGFVIEMDHKRIYYAGDTDVTPEMVSLHGLDLVLMPVGGTYTMDAEEAARAVAEMEAVRAVPYHFGDIVGGPDDADRFARGCRCRVTVLEPGQSLTL